MADVVAEFALQTGLDAQGKSEFSRWPSQSARSLEEFHAKCAETFEDPAGSAFERRSAHGIVNTHLQLTRKIVREDRAHQKDLIASKGTNRNVVHVDLVLEFGENFLLRSTAIMKLQNIVR